MASPPRVHRVLHLALSLAGVRLGLGAIGFPAALAAGAEPEPRAVALGVGVGGSLVGLVSSQRWALVEQPASRASRPTPSGPWGLVPALGRALLPSTAGRDGPPRNLARVRAPPRGRARGRAGRNGRAHGRLCLDVASARRRGSDRLLFADALASALRRSAMTPGAGPGCRPAPRPGEGTARPARLVAAARTDRRASGSSPRPGSSACPRGVATTASRPIASSSSAAPASPTTS